MQRRTAFRTFVDMKHAIRGRASSEVFFFQTFRVYRQDHHGGYFRHTHSFVLVKGFRELSNNIRVTNIFEIHEKIVIPIIRVLSLRFSVT